MIDRGDVARFERFDRQEWAALRAQTPLTIREKDLEALRGINDQLDLDEVTAVYLPLTRLLNLYVSATQSLHRVSTTFLGTIAPKLPYIIGVAGSVAVGKSTLARLLQTLLSRWPEHPRVELITTDGFLARTPPCGIDHHRRFFVSQRRARSARHHGPQGLP